MLRTQIRGPAASRTLRKPHDRARHAYAVGTGTSSIDTPDRARRQVPWVRTPTLRAAPRPWNVQRAAAIVPAALPPPPGASTMFGDRNLLAGACFLVLAGLAGLASCAVDEAARAQTAGAGEAP